MSDSSHLGERRGPALPARHQCALGFDPPTSGTGGRDACQTRVRYRLHQHRRGGRAALRRSQAWLQGIDGKIDHLLASLPVLSLNAGADHTYAEIRLQLEQAGTPIGPNDLLIAADALHSGLTLVTDNTDEFGRVTGLQLENWLDGPASAR